LIKASSSKEVSSEMEQKIIFLETPKQFSNNITEIISSNNVFKETLSNLAKNKKFNVININKPYEELAISDAKNYLIETTKVKIK
jgi:hypothetical protein